MFFYHQISRMYTNYLCKDLQISTDKWCISFEKLPVKKEIRKNGVFFFKIKTGSEKLLYSETEHPTI